MKRFIVLVYETCERRYTVIVRAANERAAKDRAEMLSEFAHESIAHELRPEAV